MRRTTPPPRVHRALTWKRPHSAFAATYQPRNSRTIIASMTTPVPGFIITNDDDVATPSNRSDNVNPVRAQDEVKQLHEKAERSASHNTSTTVLNPHSGAAVILRGIAIPLESDIGSAFVSDCARNRERLISDQLLCERFGITSDDLKTISANPAVRLAVSAEAERRTHSGLAAQESAAKLFQEAPEVLGKILKNESASPRHRIEAARELRATAQPGAERAGDTADKVVVHINLGNDRLLFEKQIAPFTIEQAKENLDAD